MVSLVDHMISGAEKVTGDKIVVAGAFMRRGAEAGEVVGSLAGLAAGSVIGHGQEFNTAALGGLAGRSAADGGPPRAYVVALSETKIHVLETTTSVRGISREQLALIHTFERGHVYVSTKSQALVRSLTVEDPDTGQKLEFESERNWKAHGKDVIEALGADTFDDDASSVPSEEG